MTDYSKKPWGFKWRSHTLFILVTIGIGLFCDLFLYALIIPVIPFILRDQVGLGKDQIQKQTSNLLAVYAGSSCLLSPVAGLIADKTKSRQRPFVFGVLALIAATLLLFVGKSVAVLMIARTFQGASGAVIWTVGLALCIDTVGPKNLGKTIGTMFGFIGVGELLAPALGGLLYEKTGYAGVLAVSIAVLAVDLAMRLVVIEKSVAAHYERQDCLDQEANASGDVSSSSTQAAGSEDADEETALLPKPVDEDDNDYEGPNMADELDDAYLIPHPDQQPLIYREVPLLYCITHSASLVLSFVVAFAQAFIIASYDATIPTEAHDLFGFDSMKAGLLFVPPGVLSALIGPSAGAAVDKYGVKVVAVVGYGFLAIPLTCLRFIKADPFPQEVYLYAALLGLTGIGGAIIGAPALVESGAVVEKYYRKNPEFFGERGPYAQLYGINSMAFCAGLSIGPLVAGYFRESIGYGNMNAVVAGFSATIAIACFIWLGGPPKIPRRKASIDHS